MNTASTRPPRHWLDSLLIKLSNTTYADKVVVFGSVAAGKDEPGDLDIAVDARHSHFKGPDQLDRYVSCLRMSLQHYGRFDPFVLFDDYLVVRSADALTWCRAKNGAAITKAITTRGRPLADILKVRHLPPIFKPEIKYVAGVGEEYSDGRVTASVSTSECGGRLSIAIHEWSSRFKGEGHTTQALRWLRKNGYEHITANGVGMPTAPDDTQAIDGSTAYWLHMHAKGLVDTLLDDEGAALMVDGDRGRQAFSQNVSDR